MRPVKLSPGCSCSSMPGRVTSAGATASSTTSAIRPRGQPTARTSRSAHRSSRRASTSSTSLGPRLRLCGSVVVTLRCHFWTRPYSRSDELSGTPYLPICSLASDAVIRPWPRPSRRCRNASGRGQAASCRETSGIEGMRHEVFTQVRRHRRRSPPRSYRFRKPMLYPLSYEGGRCDERGDERGDQRGDKPTCG